MIEEEFIEGYLQDEPEFKLTSNGKSLCKVTLKTEDEVISIVAWENNAEILNDLQSSDRIIIKGYRKFNDYLEKEEFIIKQFIKREKAK